MGIIILETKRWCQLRRKILKIVLMGEMNVGKTTMINKFCGKDVSAGATIGPGDFQKKELMVGTTQMSLQIWDTAGQEKFNAIGVPFYRSANACGLVFDLGDMESFNKLSHWRDSFIDNNGP